jgi:hypothetical protein
VIGTEPLNRPLRARIILSATVRLIEWDRMRKPEIAKQMARRARVSEAEAADRLDAVVHEILSSLRKGDEASLPGLGMFLCRADGRVTFRKSGGKRRG